MNKDKILNMILAMVPSKILEALSESDEYANFIMANGDRLICNGDMLLDAMEDGYLFDEFLIKKFH